MAMTEPKPFSVIVRRCVVYEARVDVHADTQARAEREARDDAESDLVNWVQVHEETETHVYDD